MHRPGHPHLAIEVRALSTLSGARATLRDLTFSVPRGTLAAVIGPGGSGKTTLMKLLAGHLTPTGGRIRLCGIDIRTARLELSSRVGYVPAHGPRCGQMPLGELLAFSARARQVEASTLDLHLRDIATRCDLAHALSTPFGELDAASHRLAALALALLHGPDVLLLDAYLDGLDAAATLRLDRVLAGLRGAHTVLLTGTHDVLWGLPADQVLRLDAGRLVSSHDTGVARPAMI